MPTSRAGRATMSNAEDRKARRERHAAIRAEIADEEDAAGMAEAAEYAAALEVPLHVRVSRDLDAELRRRADVAGMSTSALVRRLLTQAVHRGGGALSASETAEVETIARRVAREEFQDH